MDSRRARPTSDPSATTARSRTDRATPGHLPSWTGPTLTSRSVPAVATPAPGSAGPARGERGGRPRRPCRVPHRRPPMNAATGSGSSMPALSQNVAASALPTAAATSLPQPPVAASDLLLRHVVAAGPVPVGDARHGEILGHHDHVQSDVVAPARASSMSSSLDGCENTVSAMSGRSHFDETRPGRRGDGGRLVGVDLRRLGPALAGDLVGVDDDRRRPCGGTGSGG